MSSKTEIYFLFPNFAGEHELSILTIEYVSTNVPGTCHVEA
jgi:hypothetical protein